MGGNIANKLENWESLTSDPFISGSVKGVSLDFLSWPAQEQVPRPYRMNLEQSQFIDGEIISLIKKQIIERVEDILDQYVSNIFLKPKPNGTFRMIIDLSLLNNDIVVLRREMVHTLCIQLQ